MTASNPQSWIPQGACSRDDPEPKLGPLTSTLAFRCPGRLRTKSGSRSPPGVLGPVVEEELPVAAALDPLEELFGHDLVGVDVAARQGSHGSRDRGDRIHLGSQVLTSTKWPATAAAAAISGLTRWVRPPRPCLPSKLRFDVEAAALAGGQNVVVHGQAHGASGVAPFETGLLEDTVQALFLGLELDQTRAGHHHRLHPPVDLPSRHDRGRGPQVLYPGVCARAEEHPVEMDVGYRRPCLEVHVFERPPASFPIERVLVVVGMGYPRTYGGCLGGIGPPRNVRLEGGGVHFYFGIEGGARVTGEGSPVVQGLIPCLRCVRSPF